jgi:hypothetical protein
VGDQTRLIRLAYAYVETKKKRSYGAVIAVLFCLTLAIGIFAYYQHWQLTQQRATAQ